MLEKEPGTVKMLKTLLMLVAEKKAFAKCPKCGKSLGLFEIYNSNCSCCGRIDFGDVIMVEGVPAEKD